MNDHSKRRGADNSDTGRRPLLNRLQHDFLASIVVFLVALPLCIGIAVAVGVNPARALITGIIGGLVVGFLSGSPLQVSGPAAGLFVIVADLISRGREAFIDRAGGELEGAALEAEASSYALIVMAASVFLAGVLQVIAGRLHLGQWFRAVSPAVIKGMLAGIGVLIVISQFHVMLDHQPTWNGEPAHGGLEYIAGIPEAIFKCFSPDTSANHHLAALTGIITIACIVLWPLVAPKKLRLFPAALLGVIMATAFAAITRLNIRMLDVPDSVVDEMDFPTWTWAELMFDPMVLTGALVIAIIASAETLLCATAVDQMHDGEKTKYDKELSAQGIGNMACGLVGALPLTGVIVRSSANVNSGAQSRVSTILHGLWLLIFVAAIPFVLNYIPRAALGALLVYTGFKLVNIKEIKQLWETSKSETAIYFVTMIVIVSADLLVGVITGIVLSAAKLLHVFSQLNLQLTVAEDRRQAVLRMDGAATFLRLPLLARKLEHVPDAAELHVDFEDLRYIDHACLDLLMSWAKQHHSSGGSLVVDWEQLHGRFSTESNGFAKDRSEAYQDQPAANQRVTSPELEEVASSR